MKHTMMVLVAMLGLSLIAVDADAARRLGGGASLGKQRQITPAPKAPAPSAAPAAPAQQPSGMSKWLGPLAGLALGAGLVSLFMNNGFAGALGGILLILLIAAAAMFAWRMLRRAPTSGPLQYAGGAPASREQGSRLRDATGRESGAAPSSAGVASVSGVTSPEGAPVPPSDGAPSQGSQPSISNMFGGGATAPATASNRFPPGFDAEQFARHAKLNFTRLQAVNDQHDLATMREFMTPELYAEIEAQIDKTPQKTDVVTLDAEVLEVVTEGEAYIASVRFSGAIRESADALPESFSEVWHLEKPVSGNTGWLLCGIQQG